jgi:hypothetical protein
MAPLPAAPENSKRRLLWVPIVHSPEDLGSLSSAVRRASTKKTGHRGWKKKVETINQIWKQIERSLENRSLPWTRVRLYQDGLPICGREWEIVKELADAGSPNHRILLKLVKRGAKLMGTESPDLLLEEYELSKRVLQGAESEDEEHVSREAALLLERRDRFIAKRIDDTLASGETGVIFLGMLHSLEPWLDRELKPERIDLPP